MIVTILGCVALVLIFFCLIGNTVLSAYVDHVVRKVEQEEQAE